MKTIILSLFFIILTQLTNAQKKSIDFEHDLSWEQIKIKAEKEQKFIFMDVFASWCAPCKWMDNYVFSSELVGAFLNDRFISVKLQMDSVNNDSNFIQNPEKLSDQIRHDYNVNGYPTFLFFDSKGKAVHKFSGVIPDSTFLKLAQNALDTKRQYFTLLAEYKGKTLGYNQFPYLVQSSSYAGDSATANLVANDYIDNYLFKLDDKLLKTKDNLSFIKDHLGSTVGKGFQFFVKNREQINLILGSNQAEYSIRSVIADEFIPGRSTWKVRSPNWEALEQEISSKFGVLGREMVYGKQMIYHLESNDWKNFKKYYVLYYQSALKRSEWNVNNVSWKLFKNVNDLNVLKFACDVVMKYAMEEWYQNDAAAYDTYANLLYKCGRSTQAIWWQKKALELSKGTIYEPEQLDHLAKMEKGEKTWIDK
ncbi:thioredoxin family protein [Pedobacter panaciterrae]|uniref:thioredoxin family protein n=1 Tax=Pedobacter panaciterrae TaxID=363849 RepID=UPI00155DB543|nr:thioredoxin family protein [Pedobacter panaciterrae]NQX54430.1 thioredoxin family protein [Pedobacter panaciterrae]